MSYTRAQLVNQALIDLGVIAEGQDVSANDLLKMDGYVNGAMAMLTDLDIFYVADFGVLGPDGGDIHDSAFLPIAKYLANQSCAGFNLPADAKLQALSDIAEATLRTLSRPPRSKARLSVDPAARGLRRGVYSIWPNNG
jgi:hypothetical protein